MKMDMAILSIVGRLVAIAVVPGTRRVMLLQLSLENSFLSMKTMLFAMLISPRPNEIKVPNPGYGGDGVEPGLWQ